MTCPYCEFDGTRMAIHAHMGENHGDRVELGHHDGPNDPYFKVACPFCDQESIQSVNPGGRDPRFLDEFAETIRLVAFDLLLFHLQDEHPAQVGLPPHAPSAEAAELDS